MKYGKVLSMSIADENFGSCHQEVSSVKALLEPGAPKGQQNRKRILLSLEDGSSSGADRTLFAGSSIFLFSWTPHLHLTWTSHLNGKILTDYCRGRLQFRLTSWTFLVQHGWPATPRRTTAQWSELGPGESKHKTDKT